MVPAKRSFIIKYKKRHWQGVALRQGVEWVKLLFLGLRLLRAVLGARLHTALHALGIEGTTDDVVTDTGKVLDTAAADEHDRVFLQIVAAETS